MKKIILLLMFLTPSVFADYYSLQQQSVIKDTTTIRNDFYWRGSFWIGKSSSVVSASLMPFYLILRDSGSIDLSGTVDGRDIYTDYLYWKNYQSQVQSSTNNSHSDFMDYKTEVMISTNDAYNDLQEVKKSTWTPIAGTNVTLTPDGNGNITIAASGGGGGGGAGNTTYYATLDCKGDVFVNANLFDKVKWKVPCKILITGLTAYCSVCSEDGSTIFQIARTSATDLTNKYWFISSQLEVSTNSKGGQTDYNSVNIVVTAFDDLWMWILKVPTTLSSEYGIKIRYCYPIP